MSDFAVVVGIDVAKDHVDVNVLGAPFEAGQFANDAEGHTALVAELGELSPGLIVLEATRRRWRAPCRPRACRWRW